MRVVCLTYSLIGHMALNYLLEETEDEVVGVFTHEDAPGEEVWWPSVAQLAAEHQVPVFTPENLNQPQWVEQVRALKPDFILGGWYRRIVKAPILDLPPGGSLNLHGSLLPKYRGRAPINWVLANGERETGMTLHYMVPRADAGDIVAQAVVPITDDDIALSLYYKMAGAGLEVLRASWPLLREGRAPRIPQDESQASYFGGRKPEDGCFEWEWPAARIGQLVRAVTHPYPGAFVELGGRRLWVWAARPVAGLVGPLAPPPGSVVRIEEAGFTVATGQGYLLVSQAQLEGEGERLGGELAAGQGFTVGDILR